MKEIRKYRIYPSDLRMFPAFRDVAYHLAECKYTEHLGYCQNERFFLKINDDRSIHAGSFAEFLKVLEKYPAAMPLWVHSHWQKKDKDDIMCGIDVSHKEIEVSIEANDLNTMAAMHDKVREIFHAVTSAPEKSPSLSRYDLKRTVFLAHRFDDQGNTTAAALGTFLRRLGFDVAEGSGYEARDIPEKVADKIRSQDIFVCVATPGDLSWILSELAFAKALNKYIIILCQNELEFNRGIVGADHEFMPFPKGTIEKTYSDLLYALPS